ncbi:hypothetical protein [Cryobacterium sp. LW097]|uniref:hypothetical protein n=1 Tax=Cryobacterium sp. LW097 TaxID=1978566 RepID=UPI0012494392|nr:hypothetical protein [Cryobacterium sp. LW097]
MYITDTPHDPNHAAYRSSYGARLIEMYEIRESDVTIGHALGVRAVNKRQWEVAGGRDEFPVGNVWRPEAVRVPDRFTHDHLVQMAERFGLRPFDEDFYAPDGTGIMVERTDPVEWDQRRATLAQARGEEPHDS